MDSSPDWLAPLARLEDFDGDAEAYIEHLFSLFTRDFIGSQPSFRGKRVFHDKRDDGGKPQAFSHITTEGNRHTGERELCLRRCERMAWIRAVIEHETDPRVLVWEKEQQTARRRAVRTYLFLEQQDFLVILQEIKWGHYMVTAIYVDNPNQKKKHLKAYRAFKKNRP